MIPFITETEETPRLIQAVTSSGFDNWLADQAPHIQNWLAVSNVTKAPVGGILPIPTPEGNEAMILLGVEDHDDIWSWGACNDLPEGIYRLADDTQSDLVRSAILGWGIGTYRFDRYKKRDQAAPTLLLPEGDHHDLISQIKGVRLTRDLINLPALDMGPEELADTAETLAEDFDANCHITIGNDLITSGFPLVYAVGMASTRSPRLIDLSWSPEGLDEETLPKVTLVGKGVCFDTGGLDLKPSNAMLTMKKDMGGAAQVLGLASMVMENNLPIRLRVLIPAVENSVAGNALRPMDILRSRSGQTIEIGNTDAEGRVILADALTLACEDEPDFILDFATLTGAARVAVGTDLPAFFCNDEELAEDILSACEDVDDPVWRMPLFKRYRKMINGKNADLNNAPAGPYAGAITAALFLEAFIESDISWGHFDLMAYNVSSSSGKPEGGEAQGIRGVYRLLRNRYK